MTNTMRITIAAAIARRGRPPRAAQRIPAPDSAARAAQERLIDGALKDSAAWNRLALLADTFGNRPTGSARLEHAIDWIVEQMKKDGLDNVHTEPVTVSHWERGAESAVLLSPRLDTLHMLGLGKSVGTPKGGITAPVLVVKDFADLRAHAADAKGKIVLFDFPFSTTKRPFEAYGEAVAYRGVGADSAMQFGAVAVLVRSVTPMSLRTPHTGALRYGDSTRRIPAAAVSVEDAQMLHRMQDRGQKVEVRLTMGARFLPMTQSRNVVAEVRGTERPDEVIVLGGHIDSWDVGSGAMDDGGGSRRRVGGGAAHQAARAQAAPHGARGALDERGERARRRHRLRHRAQGADQGLRARDGERQRGVQAERDLRRGSGLDHRDDAAGDRAARAHRRDHGGQGRIRGRREPAHSRSASPRSRSTPMAPSTSGTTTRRPTRPTSSIRARWRCASR